MPGLISFFSSFYIIFRRQAKWFHLDLIKESGRLYIYIYFEWYVRQREILVQRVGRYHQHGRQSHEPPDCLAPPGIHVAFEREALIFHQAKYGHGKAEQRRQHQPTHFPESARIVADHVLDVLVEALIAVTPRHGNALEEHEREQRPAARRIRVEYVEYVDAALGEIGEAEQVGDGADESDEQLFPLL